MRQDIWIIVANSAKARILKAKNNDTLQEIEILEHPEARLERKELVCDKPGNSAENGSPKKQEAISFAKEIADHIKKICTNEPIKNFYLAASPIFLGLLRHELNNHAEKFVTQEVSKDITSLPLEKIRSYFPLVL